MDDYLISTCIVCIVFDMSDNYKIYNKDCIEGMREHVQDSSIDLIFTDPPYGIEIGGKKDIVHAARNQSLVVPGYVDVPIDKYASFSNEWISEAARCLRPGGSMYIVSGYTGLVHVLNALHSTELVEINHLIAQYTFGISTRKKWVSSHYHILYWVKPPNKLRTFNTGCRFTDLGDSYHDRTSVQLLRRNYKHGQIRNANQLPEDFIEKFILYSSNRGDVVMDPFCGGFTTGRVCLRYGRVFVGFEVNNNAVDTFLPTLKDVVMADPVPVQPSQEEMIKRIKKRQGYRQARINRENKLQKIIG